MKKILGELGEKIEIKGDYDKVLNFRELAPRPLPRIRKNRPSKSELGWGILKLFKSGAKGLVNIFGKKGPGNEKEQLC